MGAGIHGGFGGTFGSQDANKENELQTTKKVETTIPSETELISELKANGIKFTEEDMVFITKDKTGQTVWLEKGNSSAGLEHIEMRHTDDFYSKHGIKKTDIPNHLKFCIQNGNVEYSRVTDRNGGYERLYNMQGQYYLQTGIGNNGFVVSAYPIDENQANKLIRRYKK